MTTGIRDAAAVATAADAAGDAAACAAIYAPYVTDTALTFEDTPPSAEEMAARIATAQRDHAWLVGERDGEVVGFAYGGSWRSRPAYRFACEVSVYLQLGLRRTGTGRALYAALLQRLTERGFHVALGGIALPNEASVALHRALGFQDVGTFRRVGWKFGRWHDVAWCQRELAGGEPDRSRPR